MNCEVHYKVGGGELSHYVRINDHYQTAVK